MKRDAKERTPGCITAYPSSTAGHGVPFAGRGVIHLVTGGEDPMLTVAKRVKLDHDIETSADPSAPDMIRDAMHLCFALHPRPREMYGQPGLGKTPRNGNRVEKACQKDGTCGMHGPALPDRNIKPQP